MGLLIPIPVPNHGMVFIFDPSVFLAAVVLAVNIQSIDKTLFQIEEAAYQIRKSFAETKPSAHFSF